MIMPSTPISAMAATPRIDTDKKYQFNPLAKVSWFFIIVCYILTFNYSNELTGASN